MTCNVFYMKNENWILEIKDTRFITATYTNNNGFLMAAKLIAREEQDGIVLVNFKSRFFEVEQEFHDVGYKVCPDCCISSLMKYLKELEEVHISQTVQLGQMQKENVRIH